MTRCFLLFQSFMFCLRCTRVVSRLLKEETALDADSEGSETRHLDPWNELESEINYLMMIHSLAARHLAKFSHKHLALSVRQ